MSTIIPYFDPILGKLRNSDVALISLASLIVPDPLVVNNLIVNSNASINTLKTNAITNTSTISTNGLGLNFAQWNSNTSLGPLEGLMNWSSLLGTIQLGLAGGNVDIPLGLTTNLPKRVRNSTGSTMPKGTAVYINGVSGNTPTIDRAIATGDRTSAFTIGMTAESIANNGTGWVTSFGLIRGLNLSSFTGGDTLYLSGATAGYYTNVPTKAPIHYVRVGTVTRATTDGELIVNVINGYESDELHDVIIASLASGQILQSGASSYWYNRSLASAVNDFIVFPAFPSLGSLAVMNQLSFTSLLNQPSLSSLAYQSTVDYVTQVTSKPSLGSLAPLNSLSYGSILNLPSLGSLAQQNTVDYSQITNTPSLGSLAIMNQLSYGSILNTPSLGSLAVLNDLSYTSLLNLPSLGSLAVLNDLSYTSLLNLPSLGSLAQISDVVSPLVLSGATLSISQASIVHDNLGGLTTGDPHTQYALLAGRSGGQTLFGGTVANNPLSLRANSATGNSANTDAIRLGVGDNGATNALVLSQNGKLTHTVAHTFVNGYTLNQTITGTVGDSIGAFYNVTDTGGGVKTIFAHRARLTYSGSGTISGMQATSNQMVVNGGGTVNAAEILTSNLTVENNSTVNNAKLIRLFTPSVQTGGVITGLTGIDIPDLTVAEPNAYAIYSDGGKSYHKGNFGIAMLPSFPLDVTGDIRSSANVRANNFLGNTADSATAPSYTFDGDTNTGMFHPTTDNLGFTTAGTERIRINSTGFVGILNSTPSYALDVTGDIRSSGNVIANNGIFASQVSVNIINSNGIFASTASFGVVTAENVIANNGVFADTVFISNGYLKGNSNNAYTSPQTVGTGDILSGDATGIFQFDASAGFQYLQRSSADAVPPIMLFYKSRGATNSPSAITAGDTAGRLSFYAFTGASVFDEVARMTAETTVGADQGVFRFSTAPDRTTGPVERLTILPSGLVGVGVANPVQRLDVNGVAQAIDFYASDTDAVGSPAFTWSTDTNTGMYNASADVIGFTTAGVERMRVGATGNVGIGTTTTTVSKLHIDQSNNAAVLGCLTLDQADASEEYFDFVTPALTAGNPVNTTALGTYYGRARVRVNGTQKWIAIYND